MDFPVKNAVSHQFDDGSLCDILDRRTYYVVHEEEGRESLIGLDGLALGRPATTFHRKMEQHSGQFQKSRKFGGVSIGMGSDLVCDRKG